MRGPDAFGTVALPVRKSRYDARWRRAASPADAAVGAFVVPARALTGARQAEAINAAMNQRVGYRFDAPRDDWAPAAATLRDLAGDCEDIAIAKMQALIALGVPASDLYMSIGQDSAAGAIHAVLLVRLGERFFVLDNRSDRPIPQEAFTQFTPILSFSRDGTWVHGYRVRTAPAEMRSLAIAAAAGRLVVGGRGSSPAAARG